MINIVEIKAQCEAPNDIRNILKERGAEFKGIDHQIDTYFNVPKGRLKLREGNIELTLIHYHRPNQAGPKLSEVSLYKPKADPALKAVLTSAIGVLTVVDKQREIYFIDNVKFHIDVVQGLGNFMEIEAIDEEDKFTNEELLNQCQHYMALFGIQETNLIDLSYSDLILGKTN